ncbi:hypothetical protein D3C87_1486530 [compost metagenome]
MFLNPLWSLFTEQLEKLEKHLEKFCVIRFLRTFRSQCVKTHFDTHFYDFHWVGDHVGAECRTTDDDHLSKCCMDDDAHRSTLHREGTKHTREYYQYTDKTHIE